MPPPTKPQKDRCAILKIVAVYALFAGLWIFLSDKAVGLVVKDPEARIEIAILKGWGFVAITSALLYFLIRRFFREAAERTQQQLRTLGLLTVNPPYPSCHAKARMSANVAWIHSDDRFLTWRSMSAWARSEG